ncbi:MAG: ribonuclease T2 [Sphingomonas adhaesiva]|uniref:ribonuclease T2 n=1 Tax=Sphingomonas adhaesiva TaxID=28212 RepID=UPI002FF9E2DB
MPMAIAMGLAMVPGAAAAQALSCEIPAQLPRPRPDLPSASQPVRRLPIASYTLAISWSPEFCRTRADRPNAQFQCGGGNRFGFVLHGLWPDGPGKDWPQYCRATPILSRKVIRDHLCATPSPQLLQHEWAKHGTCMAGYTPQRYFAKSNALFAQLRFPDMERLSRTPQTAGRLAEEMARSNPGLGVDMMRITTTRQGWLDEIWLCLDKRFRYARCPTHQGGVTPATTVRIWRGRAMAAAR